MGVGLLWLSQAFVLSTTMSSYFYTNVKHKFVLILKEEVKMESYMTMKLLYIAKFTSGKILAKFWHITNFLVKLHNVREACHTMKCDREMALFTCLSQLNNKKGPLFLDPILVHCSSIFTNQSN